MSPNQTDPDVASFFSSWEIYRAVIDSDVMEHRAIYSKVHSILAQRTEPFTLLDLGCGDAAGIGTALEGTRLERYVGIDCAAPALEFAGQTLAGLDAVIDLRLGDLMDSINDPTQRFDVILVSFALHHFADDDKRAFLTAARERLNPGGEVILIDVVRRPGESRDEYLSRYGTNVASWPLEADKQERIMAHVTGFDYPADIIDEPQWAADRGFDVEEFYRGGNDTQCAWRLLAAQS